MQELWGLPSDRVTMVVSTVYWRAPLAQPPTRDIRKDPGRDQHCTRSCILAPEILDTVCVRGRLPRTIVSRGRSSHPDFSQTSAVVSSSSSFLLFTHSHVVYLYHFTCCSCRTFPAPSATASFRFSFQSRQFTTTGTHGLPTFGQIRHHSLPVQLCT